jgi:hypothetical protein
LQPAWQGFNTTPALSRRFGVRLGKTTKKGSLSCHPGEQVMARAYLIIAGLMWLVYGIYLLAMPQALSSTAGVAATTLTGLIELRAMYGGLEMAVGIFALLAAWLPGMLRGGLLGMGLACGGLGVTRLLSATLAGEFSTYTRQGLALEFTLTVLALWLFLRQPVDGGARRA